MAWLTVYAPGTQLVIAEHGDSAIVDWDMTVQVNSPVDITVTLAGQAARSAHTLVGYPAFFSTTATSRPTTAWAALVDKVSMDWPAGRATLSLVGTHALLRQPGSTTGGLRRGGATFWQPSLKGVLATQALGVAVAPDRSKWWQTCPSLAPLQGLWHAHDWFVGAWADGGRQALNSNWSVSSAGTITSRPNEYQCAIEFPFSTTGDWVVVHSASAGLGRVQATVQTPPSSTLGVGLVAGYASATDFYTVEFTSTQVLIRRRSGSTYTTLASASLSSAPAAGDVIAAVVDGAPATITAYLRGEAVASASGLTLNGYKAGIKVWSSSGTPTVYLTGYVHVAGAASRYSDPGSLTLHQAPSGDAMFGPFAGEVLDAVRRAAQMLWVPKQGTVSLAAAPEATLHWMDLACDVALYTYPYLILGYSDIVRIERDASGLATSGVARYGTASADYIEGQADVSVYGLRRFFVSASSKADAQLAASDVLLSSSSGARASYVLSVPRRSDIVAGKVVDVPDTLAFCTQHRQSAGSELDELVIGPVPR